MAYHSKYSGAEVDALLDKIKDDNVGSIDSSLSTTSENPVQNKVITGELNKKANKKYVDDFAATKQDVLTAGAGIVIDDNNTISINFDPDIFKVVSVLPVVPAEGDDKKIHLVPSEDAESGNAYDEYVYVDGSWEKIGSFRPSIDLSDYAKTADIPVKKGVGDNSIVHKGGSNSASGTYSSAFGFNTVSYGTASHTEGISTIAQNAFEHAEGIGNLSINDKTVHTVGIGSLDGRDRKNAEEIHRSGDKYVIGIGGYDGTNSQTEGVKTLQEVIGEKTDQSYVNSQIAQQSVRQNINETVYGNKTIHELLRVVNGIEFNNTSSGGPIIIDKNDITLELQNVAKNPGVYLTGLLPISPGENYMLDAAISKSSLITMPWTISSQWVFSNGLRSSTIPYADDDVTNKKYVDDKYTALETKNTELTNKITTLEARIAELENIISQITIKEE